MGANSSIISKFSSKYTVLIEFTPPSNVKAFSLVSFSNKKSIELDSGSHTASEDNLLVVPFLYSVGLRGTSIC